MPPPFRRSLPIAGVAVLMTAALALADPPAGATPHVRPETREAHALLLELTARSETARGLVDAIDRSTFVVYIRHRVFTPATWDGRIGLVRSSRPTRFLILELAAGRPWLDQLVALGHELQHAAEIAGVGAALAPDGLARHYTRIGDETGGIGEARTFETGAARAVAARVRRELSESSMRPTHDRE
jgi:hypothetical protein